MVVQRRRVGNVSCVSDIHYEFYNSSRRTCLNIVINAWIHGDLHVIEFVHGYVEHYLISQTGSVARRIDIVFFTECLNNYGVISSRDLFRDIYCQVNGLRSTTG